MILKNNINLLFHEICDIDNCSNSGFNYIENEIYACEIKTFRQIVEFVHENKLKANFSFDDGGSSNLVASRILDEYNLKGTFFIPTFYIGKPGFLRKQDILNLYNRGHFLGSHSHNHPIPISFLDDEEQFSEWEISKSILEEIVQDKITLAALPGGDSNFKTFDILNKLGFHKVYTSYPNSEYKNLHNNLTIIGRVCIMRYHDVSFIKSLSTSKLVTLRLVFVYKLKEFIKRKFKFIFKYFTKNRKHK